MKKSIIVLLCLCAFVVSGFAQETLHVVVFDFQPGPGASQDEAAIFAELVRNQFRLQDEYHVVPRRLMLDQAFRAGIRLDNEHDEFRLAELLKADLVIRGRLVSWAGVWRAELVMQHSLSRMLFSTAWYEAPSYIGLMTSAEPLVRRLLGLIGLPGDSAVFDEARIDSDREATDWYADETTEDESTSVETPADESGEYIGLTMDDKVALISDRQESSAGRSLAIWRGLVKASAEYGFDLHWRPSIADEEALFHIGALRDEGYRLFFLSGDGFSPAVYQAQYQYPDCYFILFDVYPELDGQSPDMLPSNTSVVVFTEHHAGFLGGVAAALALKQGEAGFMAAMEIPPFQYYMRGFDQGLRYANDQYGTAVTLDRHDIFMYMGLETPGRAGEIASYLFENGITLLMSASEQAEHEVIEAAVAARAAGLPVWLLGIDFARSALDNYGQELYLTSAIKDYETTALTLVYNSLRGSGPFSMAILWDAAFYGLSWAPLAIELDPEDAARLKKVKEDLAWGAISVNRWGDTD